MSPSSVVIGFIVETLSFSSHHEILITKNLQIQKYESTYATALI